MRFPQAKRILEIGVFTSTTTVALALLPQVERIVALDIEPYLVEFAKPFYKQAQVENKIDFRIGSAIKTLEDLEAAGETFDMVFIDADKDNYFNYYERIISSKSLLSPDGIIVAVIRRHVICRLRLHLHALTQTVHSSQDNTIYKSSVYVPHDAFKEGQKSLGDFNRQVRQDPRVNVVLIPVRDGISLIRRAQ